MSRGSQWTVDNYVARNALLVETKEVKYAAIYFSLAIKELPFPGATETSRIALFQRPVRHKNGHNVFLLVYKKLQGSAISFRWGKKK